MTRRGGANTYTLPATRLFSHLNWEERFSSYLVFQIVKLNYKQGREEPVSMTYKYVKKCKLSLSFNPTLMSEQWAVSYETANSLEICIKYQCLDYSFFTAAQDLQKRI